MFPIFTVAVCFTVATPAESDAVFRGCITLDVIDVVDRDTFELAYSAGIVITPADS